MASVTFKQLNKVYDGKVQALKDIDLKVNAQDFLVIVGPSGCGKTTLLMILAGLERETSGEVWIDDTCVNNVDPKDRDVAVVFQSYALYPHMTVFGNMAFSLKVRRKKKDFINRKVAEVAEMLNLTEYLKRKPHQLSGGQKQRVAIGRAIVREPKVFLLDEPLSNLDIALRNKMRDELKKLHSELGATIVYVTHDQVEAMTLATTIVVLNEGEIQQVGTPFEIFMRPKTRFVASFIGSPQMNFFKIVENEKRLLFWDSKYELSAENAAQEKIIRERGLCVGIRPEDFVQGEKGIEFTIASVEMIGSEVILHGAIFEDGTGKTTVGRQLSQQLGISFYEASELIRIHNGEEYGAVKHVKDVNRNQEILIEEITKILRKEKAIILAGHFAIFTKERLVEVIPDRVFSQLGLTSIILLETGVEKAIKHLKGRDDKNYSEHELSALAAAEKDCCLKAVRDTGAKLIIHKMNYVNDADVLYKNILEGECK